SLAGMTTPELRFWHQLDLSSTDAAQAQLSLDGGQNWLPLMLFTAANNTVDWSEQVVSLAAFAGQTVRVRFLLITGSEGPYGAGWTFSAIALQSGMEWLSTVSTALPPSSPTAIPSTTLEYAGWTTYAASVPLLLYDHGSWQTIQVDGALGGTLTRTADRGA